MKKNKLLAVLPALAMTLTLLPTTALADGETGNSDEPATEMLINEDASSEGTSSEDASSERVSSESTPPDSASSGESPDEDSTAAPTETTESCEESCVHVAAIGTAHYSTLAEAIEAVRNNETVELLKDSAGNGIVVASDRSFTVDFNGFTYDVNGKLVGSSGTETNSLQLLKDSTITFKNGTLTSSNSTYKSQILIQNYSNLTLDNMTVSAGTPFDYVISNNNGNVVIKDTTINAAEGKVAFDVCRYSSYTGPSVTVKGNSVINGNVEISSSGAKEGAVHRLNVTGGTFNGNIYFYNTCPDFVGNITGGTFSDLESAVKYAADGANIKLAANASGNGIRIDSSKFAAGLTIDFGGHTYTVNGTTVGSSGTETQAFQLLKGGKVTFQNGIITSTTAKMLIQNYCDLTLDKMTLDGSKLVGSGTVYTLSTNNGNTVVKDSTITARATYGVAFDVCTFGSYTGNTVTIQGTSVINGDVEVSGYNDAATKLAVTGGTFNGKIHVLTGDDAPKAFTAEITGGTFSSDPSAYKGDDTIVRVDGDSTFTVVANSNLTSGTYLTIPSVASGYRYTGSEGAYVVSRIPSNSSSSGGGSSSSSNTTTATEKNPDGSTTTTTTDKKTGTVTETTKNTDGSVTTVETKKDGTVTETNKAVDGTTGTVVTDKDGAVTEVKASVSSTAAKEAGKTGGAVTLPVEVPAVKTTGDAPAVEITMPKSTGSVKVEIPVEKVTPGTVAVIVQADGTEKIVSTSAVTENGVALSLSGSTTVKVFDNAKSFTDVSATNVFYNEISSLSAREIMVGKTDEKFDLYSSVTLNQIANVAGRITGAVDVKDYNAGIAWGQENGLKTGNTAATRGDVLKALYIAAGSPMVEDTSILARFSDSASIPADIAAIAAWAAQNGILKGDLNGNASLNANVTRGQACALAGRTMGTLVLD